MHNAPRPAIARMIPAIIAFSRSAQGMSPPGTTGGGARNPLDAAVKSRVLSKIILAQFGRAN
jgi:hypothetical protein